MHFSTNVKAKQRYFIKYFYSHVTMMFFPRYRTRRANVEWVFYYVSTI